MSEATKKKRNIFIKIFIVLSWVLFGIVLTIFLIWGGLNAAKFAIYKDYFAIREKVTTISGRSDGLVVQGIANARDDEGKFTKEVITAGYMAKGGTSRLYITDKTTDKGRYVEVALKDGTPSQGHFGGVACTSKYIYIADGDKIVVLNKNDVLKAENKATVKAIDEIKTVLTASFIYYDDANIYYGEFYKKGPYDLPESHFVNISENEVNHALIGKFEIESDYNLKEKPTELYSVTDLVQGFATRKVDSKEVMYLSTSWGLSDSHLYVYDKPEAESETSTRKITAEGLTDVPLYVLDKAHLTKTLKAPAMWEDLDIVDGKLYTITESASNKYIFGKLFFANNINAIPLDKLN